jgi:copper oxidase (laccase) domain-containing protein
MTETFGSRPADLVAAIGPCLGAAAAKSARTSRRLSARRRRRASMRAWFTPGSGDRSFLDLERANRDQLERRGIDPSRDLRLRLCTKTHRARLHSYRETERRRAAARCDRIVSAAVSVTAARLSTE